ncbi:PEGA domain-containing protein [Allohahella sp. A8]|uniref:PEGA domain-containing protein n=1 Tax=Allohahella sp. A8 TaxID=3141461 RepID=UPI003A80A9C3
MVDLRPLLFVNLLVFMLFITAAFAAYEHGRLDNLLPPSIQLAGSSKDQSMPADASRGASERSSSAAIGSLWQDTADAQGRVDREPETLSDFSPYDENTEALSANEDVDEAILFVDQLEAESGPSSGDASEAADKIAGTLAMATVDSGTDATKSASDIAKRASEQANDAAEQAESTQVPADATAEAPQVSEPVVEAPAVPVKPVAPTPTTGTLVIRSNVTGDRASINGRDYGATAVTERLKPGSYEITVTKPGYEAWSTQVRLEPGAKRIVHAKLNEIKGVDFVDGVWRNNVRSGEGKYQTSDGTRYTGNFDDGQFEGFGSLKKADGTRYEGNWLDGEYHGSGTLVLPDGTKYVGTFRSGQYDGQGTLTLANGDIFTGLWGNGKLNGEGTFTSSDGDLYVGSFVNNEFHGQGTITYGDGSHYEGTFANGEYQGKGALTFADGKRYVGQFLDGKFHGLGEFMNPNGSKITGNFKFGEPFGQAKLTTAQGEVFTARTSEPGTCYREQSYRATACPELEGW